MSEEKSMRLSQAARILNRNHSAVASILAAKGYKVDNNPNTKLNAEQLEFLAKEFRADALLGTSTPKKEEIVTTTPPAKTDDSPVLYFRTSQASGTNKPTSESLSESTTSKEPEVIRAETSSIGLKVVGKIDLDAPKATAIPAPISTPMPVEEPKTVAIPPVEEKKTRASSCS